ncbi:MAG: hypothetical protein KJ674_00245 [Nanoarchaeota archaeon]|nr:hypothetical protein [Nanoarchaeota archaeon]
MKLKKFLKPRIIILLLFIIISLLIIKPNPYVVGVAIKSIETNSSASFAGLSSPLNLMPRDKELILSINNQPITNLADYSSVIDNTLENDTLKITTDKRTYTLLKSQNLGIIVEEAPTSNLIKGLELQGGTRVLLQPSEEITSQQFSDLLATMEERLNVYGLTDLTIKEASDLLGEKYIIVEIAGASKEEVQDLVSKQGKFEAKIGEDIVFSGGENDVVFVCREDGTCSGIRDCSQVSEGYQCKFEFAIKLSETAAKKHAETTALLDVNISETGYEYLSLPLDLYLDGTQVDSLRISSDLKGKEAKDILISGPGAGPTEGEAIQDALKNMNKLQTVLITGSLPTSLNIVKIDYISPTLGSEFTNNAFLVGILAIIAVAIVIFIRYRKIKIALPMLIVSSSEILIILGLAALIKYNLDLAAIAGIIAAVGTGVDDQIVITDEVLTKSDSYYNWKDKIKKAFFIIMAAYATTVAAMIPLLKAGAGLLTGFAFTIIAGVSIGVFITRPAFASIIEVLLKNE